MISELNKIVAHLKKQTEPEQMIIVEGMTSGQFDEYASELTRVMSEFEGAMGVMAIIGEELAPIFAKVAESLLEAKREYENVIRESWTMILDHFMPESWARYIVSKIPNRVIWWTIK